MSAEVKIHSITLVSSPPSPSDESPDDGAGIQETRNRGMCLRHGVKSEEAAYPFCEIDLTR